MVRTISVAIAMVVAGAAHAAAQETATGWIAHIDRDKDSVVMDDGRAFSVSPDIGVDALREGVRVRITFKRTPDGRKIIAVSPAAASLPAKKGGNV